MFIFNWRIGTDYFTDSIVTVKQHNDFLFNIFIMFNSNIYIISVLGESMADMAGRSRVGRRRRRWRVKEKEGVEKRRKENEIKKWT